MKSAVLFSGGKDSTLAVFFSIFQGWETSLVCVQSQEDSYMFHHPNTEWCKEQAEVMNLPISYVKTRNKTELADLKAHLKKLKIDCIITGAVASEYQKQRIDLLAHELGIRSFSPIWRKNEKVLEEMMRYFEIYMVAVAAEGIDAKFLSKRFDADMLEKLKKLKIHPFLEGGEGETFVSDAPFFSHRLKIGGWDFLLGNTSSTAKIAGLSKIPKC
ncbi:hypothetical protein AUJ17_04275 [Candidatus Micrarchaeota archaeon CG1_02_47_40]|nr:MAG: hypothetical protein AUJ17_04275 [Candidatus Micrarchaeota archaeon CG1_02_47_40]